MPSLGLRGHLGAIFMPRKEKELNMPNVTGPLDCYLEPREVAKQLGMKHGSVLYLLKTGQIPGLRINQKRWRINKQQLEQWVASKSTGTN